MDMDIYIYMYICVYMYIYIHIHIHIHIYMYIYVYIYGHVLKWLGFTHVSTDTNTAVTYTRTYVHIYAYISQQGGVKAFRGHMQIELRLFRTVWPKWNKNSNSGQIPERHTRRSW